MADEVYVGPGVPKQIGVPAIVEIQSFMHQGPAGHLYIWAGLLQGENIIYDVGVMSLSVAEHKTPTLVTIPSTSRVRLNPEAVPGAVINPGPADCMVLFLSEASLDQSAWLCRAIWTNAYIMSAMPVETVITNLTAVFT